MQPEKISSPEDFRCTLNRIDHFCHIKEFKSLMESKRTHIIMKNKKEDIQRLDEKFKFNDKKPKPSDFNSQMRKLVLHMIYLYYVAYIKQKDIYVYEHFCIDRYRLIFRYYSLDETHSKFMEKIRWQEFKSNAKSIFSDVYNMTKKEIEKREEEINEKKTYKSHKPIDVWIQFANTFYDIYQAENFEQISPKDMLCKLQETRHMKNNIFMVGVLSSTLIPYIKFNQDIGGIFSQICMDEPIIISDIFSDKFSEVGRKDFTNSIIRFFNILNDNGILGITSTTPDNFNMQSEEGESLLTEFRMSLGRTMGEKKTQQNSSKMQEKNKNLNPNDSHHNSEQQDHQCIDGWDLGQLKCQFFWTKPTSQNQLAFRVSIFINKKIVPLYFRDIEEVWTKLSEKWKVILDETKQLSGFNPGFLILNYNKELQQISFTEYVKCQPIQSVISQLLIATDKLIIAIFVMKDIICYYERKHTSVQTMKEELVLNEGKYEDLARSICQSVKNYYRCCKDVLMKINRL